MSERAQLSGVSLCGARRPDGSICGLPASIVGPSGGMVCPAHAPKPNMHPLSPPVGDALLLPLPEVMRRLRTHVSWGERTDGLPVSVDGFTPAIAGSVLAHIERLAQNGLLRAAMLCDEVARRYNGYATDRDSPDAPLDSACAAGAEACAKAIRLEAERMASPSVPEPEDADVPF